MKTLCYLLLLFIVAILLGFFIHQDSGYILISYHYWSLETSLWFGLLALLMLITLAYWSIRFIHNSLALRQKIKKLSQTRFTRIRYHYLSSACAQLINGQYDQAIKTLRYRLKRNPKRNLNNLILAQLCLHRNQTVQAQQYLSRVAKHDPKTYLGLQLTQVELLIRQKKWGYALEQLDTLEKRAPNNAKRLTLLLNVLQQQENWQRLHQLIPDFIKHSVLTGRAAQAFTCTIAIKRLRSAKLDDANHTVIWNQLNTAIQQDEQVFFTYLKHQTALSAEDVFKEIEKRIRKQWQPQLFLLIPTLSFDDPAAIIVRLEKLAPNNQPCQELLIALCSLYHKEAITSKLQEHLNQLVEHFPNSLSFATAADFYQQTGDQTKAVVFYKKALGKTQILES